MSILPTFITLSQKRLDWWQVTSEDDASLQRDLKAGGDDAGGSSGSEAVDVPDDLAT